MSQVLLDPGAVGSPADVISIPVLPRNVRDFGFVPNFRRCQPGDLILFSDVSPSPTSRFIAAAQKKAGFDDANCRWTHAAVFLYDDLIVEAVPVRGVVQRTLYSDIPKQIMRVRRRSTLSDIDRHKIALRALSMLGSRYSHAGVIALGWEMLKGLWTSPDLSAHRHIVICSEVFHDAYTEITRNLLSGCPVNIPITPAHLSATPDLADIDIGWLKLI